jgi:hypothetical protein
MDMARLSTRPSRPTTVTTGSERDVTVHARRSHRFDAIISG